MKNEKGDHEQISPYILLALPLGECAAATFNLEKAVCNHGLFMMAPNVWIPSTNTLQRPLRLADSTTSLTVSISHSPQLPSILVRVHGTKYVSATDKQVILSQVARMLRISGKDEKGVQEFHKVHPIAKKRGFGRLFRSPTLFEDVVKSILLCNCTWMRTLDMARALCELQLELTNGQVSLPSTQDNGDFNRNTAGKEGVKRKRTTKTSSVMKHPPLLGLGKSKSLGDFPTAKELASLSEELLEKRCNLGYRASHIFKFATSVESNRYRLKEFEEVSDMVSGAKLYKKLIEMKGLGPFACANVLMCMGFYERVPVDSETIRHLSEFHARKNCNKKNVGEITKEIYGKYAPFQCLAYWLELLEYYESKFGRLSKLPSSSYSTITGSIDKNI